MEMRVAFHSRLLTERGSEGAMLDYARLNISTLGNESVICLPDHSGLDGNPLLSSWRREFQVILYRNQHELGRILRKEGVEAVYMTKPGPWDGFLIPGVRNCVHAQFLCDEFHGDAYACLSRWMSQVMTGGELAYVPFYVPRLKNDRDLRAELRIPQEARVFGRHGGRDTFNIPFARRVVEQHARRNPTDHFLFLNTEPVRGTEKMANVHYLPATVDPLEKGAFLATCDAMLHARWHGETFGLAVGEFAVLGKPVITFSGSRERAHLEMLGDRALTYDDREDLEKILKRFESRNPGKTEYDDYVDPRRVMGLFQKVFLS